MIPMYKIGRSKKGQALVELTLLSPLLVLLAYGSIEIGNVISTYVNLTHTTREGANLASRGTDPNLALDAVIAAASPTLRTDNISHWNVIYSKVIQDPAIPCAQAPCTYKIASQIVRGSLGQSSKIGPVNQTVTLQGINSVGPGQTFHAIEVFFDYRSTILTFVGEHISPTIYDRTIFTNVSGTS